MNIKSEDLFEGEKVILSKNSNLIVTPKEFGLKKFAFDDLLWTVGMKNKEAIGGKIHLTNYRLIFISHSLNRLTGKTSIFLPTIKDVKNSSFHATKKITVETYTSKIDFIIWGIDKVIKSIQEQQSNLNLPDIEHICQLIIANPEKSSDGLKSWNALNTVNNVLLIGRKGEDVMNIVSSPFGALGSIFMKELIDKTIAEKWQKEFE
ncbi:MAG: hypothetical protein F6K19_17725 [Cyanothece sp. SIO1E1]|nr:hypothetical protein [Cyanothece sp. SIO1E1]